MQHSRDRDGEAWDVGAAFADPAFAGLKARGAPFAILKPGTGEVLWANGAAADHWGAPDAAALAEVLFGPGGRGGWLDGLDRGLVPGRPPRLARGGLARGLGMRAHTALLRAWTGPDGAVLIGLAVPDAGDDPDGEAWHRPAWPAASPDLAAPEGPEQAGPEEADVAEADVEEAGPALARRGQLAVLRDRLGRALDGAVTLRLLWRTDAADAVLSVSDAAALARLGSPLRFEGAALPAALAPFDPEGAERLRAALATRATWAGLAVALPVADGAATLPMVLSASPAFGPDRAFAGFRGFGAIDLGRLALAERRAPAAPAAEAVPDPAEGPSDGASLPAQLRDAVPEPDPAPDAAASPPDADAPAAEPRPPANVVQLRVVQAAGRFGLPAAPADGPAPDAPPFPAGEEAEPDDAPLSDQLAFLALGEALRARIGVPPPAAAEPVPAAPPDEPASPLLERLPIPVLVTVGGRTVFANAAARLGHPDADALLAPAPAGGAEAAPFGDARRAAVSWAGEAATLWILGDAATAAPAAGEAAEDPAGERSVELLDRVDDAVALLDAAGRLRRLNRRGEGWFGRAEPGRSFAELLAPESRPAALALLGEVRNQRDGLGAPPLRRDVLARAGETGPVPMLLTLGRLGASGFYATLRDLSALRRAETDRARSEGDRARLSGRLPDLLAKVSHEIRTPLGAILGFAEVMMDERFGPLGNPRYKDYLKDIHASGAQVVALVDDLLDLSRIEAGQLGLDVAAVDVNRLVAEAVAQMQPEAHRGRIIMRTSLAGRIPAVLADERSARQIVKNLLSNAVKFNEPGGQVIVSTALGDAGAVLLRVRDTGVGMTDEQVAAALEPFGGLPARPPAQGNGLGLPLTRALVGANGASMTIRSRPREGTLVEVSFAPAESGDARRPA